MHDERLCCPVLGVLFRFEVPIDYPQTVQMVQGQGQLCQVELDILFSEHDLEYTTIINVHMDNYVYHVYKSKKKEKKPKESETNKF